MKEGKITFRKVGDSTRFLQEDLDSFVKVVPSARDAENVKVFCPACHHDELVDGVLRSTGLLYFQPAKANFWTFRDSNVTTKARICTRCGAVSLFGDLGKLERIKSGKKNGAAPTGEGAKG
jgi:ribosomal protein S27AE